MRGRHVAAIVAAALVMGVGAPAASAQSPNALMDVTLAPGLPAPPVLNQTFGYSLLVRNTGDVPLDNLVVIDTVPVEMNLSQVTTGRYTGLADFAAGEGVRVSYEKNTAPGVFTLWGSSPNTTTNTTLTAPPPGLGAGEYITRVRWEYGQALAGMQEMPGSFQATGPRPARAAINRTHYYAELGERRSAAVKLTRRLTARLTAAAGTITISGRVSPPLGRPVQRVVIRRLTSCAAGYGDVTRTRPNARGRFTVTLPRVAGAALYRAQTEVPTKRGEATLRTFGLLLGVDATR